MFNLTQAIAAIAEKPEFTIRDKGDYVVIDYNLSSHATFLGKDADETKILLNLRGTAFDKETGKIIRLGFHKFFNLREFPASDSQYDITKGTVTQKLDGSCIFPIYAKSGTRLGTRAGVTDVSVLAEQWIAEDPVRGENYMQFIKFCRTMEITPIFEFCSRKNRVVIDHPVDRLVLLAIRNNWSGRYRNSLYLEHCASDFGLELVQNYSVPVGRTLVNWVRQFQDDEGVVVSFDDGHKIKIKADEYVRKHKAMDGMKFEKDVIKLILNNELDDVLPLLDAGTRQRVEDYRAKFLCRVYETHDQIDLLFTTLVSDVVEPAKSRGHDSRKAFAEHATKSQYRQFLFSMLSDPNTSLMSMLTKWILQNCSTQAGCEKVRQLLDMTHVY